MGKAKVEGSEPLRALGVGARAEHLERLRANATAIVTALEMYLANYEEAIKLGITAKGTPPEEFNQLAGELRVVRALREDLNADLEVVFPAVKLERKEVPRG